jgi:hypothetical protein
MSIAYGAAYQWMQGRWTAVSIGLTPGGAVDAAIAMYDKSGSFAESGWDTEWPRTRKAAFLRRRGMRVKKFVMTLALYGCTACRGAQTQEPAEAGSGRPPYNQGATS